MKVGRYLRNPLEVDAVRVDKDNLYDVAKWCDGEVLTEDKPGEKGGAPRKYVRVKAFKPVRMEAAFEGDWILKSAKGYKVYSHGSFLRDFSEIGPIGKMLKAKQAEKDAVLGSGLIIATGLDETVQTNHQNT